MVIFSKPRQELVPFDRERVKAEIIESVGNTYSDYHIIEEEKIQRGYDLLIIYSLEVNVEIKINSLNPYTKIEPQRLQRVIAVSILDPKEDIEESFINQTSSWTSMHLVVSDAKTVMRRLKELA